MSRSLSTRGGAWAMLAAGLLSAGSGGCGSEEACDGIADRFCGSSWRQVDLHHSVTDGVRIDLNGDGVDELALVSRTGERLLVVWEFGRVEQLGDLGDPQWIAKGDLDGDGLDDLIVASVDPLQLVLLRSVGDGSLERLREVELEKWAYALLAADLDDDGRVELLVADGERVRIFDPSGAELGDYAAGASPASLALGDLDLDGALDVVAADYEGGEVVSFRGDGRGGLSRAGSVVFGPSARDLELADVDGDGLLDVLVRDSLGGGLWLATGDGTGAFSGERSVELGFGVAEGRGLIASSRAASGLFGVTVSEDNLKTRLFAADGSLAGRSSWWMPWGASHIDDELVLGSSWAIPLRMQSGMQPVSVAAIPKREIADGTLTSPVAVGDLDGDGHQDVAVQDGSVCAVHVLFGDGTASLDGAWTEWPALESCSQLLAFDVDGDGRDELLGYSPAAMQLVYLADGGEPEIRPAVSIGAQRPILLKGPETAIFVVESGSGELTPVTVDPSGDLQPGEALPAEQALRFFAGDLDGDGDDDLAISHPGADLLSVYEQVDGALVAGPVHDLGELDPPIERWKIDSVVVADLDVDGVDEALVIGGGEVSVVRDVATEAPFVAATMTIPGAQGLHSVEGMAGDLDGDGHRDLVLREPGVFTILRGSSEGLVGPAMRVPVAAVDLASTGDFDGDGSVEFVGFYAGELRLYDSRDVTLPVLDDLVTLPLQDVYQGSEILRLGDLDGDGLTDLYLRGGSDEALAWGDGGRFSRVTTLLSSVPFDTADVQLVDLDGDGQDERVVVERAAREISAWGWEGHYWSLLFKIGPSTEHGAKQSLLAEDLDGDGVVDFAVAWGAREGDLTTGVQVAFGEPAPTLEPWTPIDADVAVLLQRPYDSRLPEEPPIEGPAPSLHSGDLDGDGRPELIFDGGRAGEVVLLWNEGDRRFRAEELDATSALIVGPGDLVLTDDDVLWRVPVYGRRLGARAKVAEVQGRLDEVTECAGDGLPDLLLRSPTSVMVGVSGSFVASAGALGVSSCGDIDGDDLPDMVSSIGAELWLRLSDPPS